MSTIQERVHAGIRLLDEKGPQDWRDEIDLSILDVRSYGKCIIGQLRSALNASDFYDAVQYLSDISPDNHGFKRYAALDDFATAHGFGQSIDQNEDEHWDALTAEWKSALAS